MKPTCAAAFAAGYIMGAKAGRERYVQIIDVAEKASRRLEEYSADRPASRRRDHPGRVEGPA